MRTPGAGQARRFGADAAGGAGHRRAGPAHPQHRGFRVLAVGLRDPCRAAPDAERRDRRRFELDPRSKTEDDTI